MYSCCSSLNTCWFGGREDGGREKVGWMDGGRKIGQTEGGREDGGREVERTEGGMEEGRQEEQTYNFENHLQCTCSCMS